MKIHLQQPRKKKRNTRKTRQKTHIHVASASCRSEIQRKCCGENKPSSGFGQSHNSLFLGNATHTHRNNIIGHLNHSTYLLFYFILFLLRLKKKRQPLVIASHRIALRRSAAHRKSIPSVSPSRLCKPSPCPPLPPTPGCALSARATSSNWPRVSASRSEFYDSMPLISRYDLFLSPAGKPISTMLSHLHPLRHCFACRCCTRRLFSSDGGGCLLLRARNDCCDWRDGEAAASRTSSVLFIFASSASIPLNSVFFFFISSSAAQSRYPSSWARRRIATVASRQK